MSINSFASRGITLGVTTEVALPASVGVDTVWIKVPSTNAAAGVTIGNTGVPAPGGDAFHLMPGDGPIPIRASNPQKLFVRGAATDKVYVLSGNLS